MVWCCLWFQASTGGPGLYLPEIMGTTVYVLFFCMKVLHLPFRDHMHVFVLGIWPSCRVHLHPTLLKTTKQFSKNAYIHSHSDYHCMGFQSLHVFANIWYWYCPFIYFSFLSIAMVVELKEFH